MNKIKIGADDLIYWLRKNQKASGKPNDAIGGVGRDIYDLIVKLGGSKIADDYPSYYENTTNFGQMNLPKTSAQYEISTSKLDELFTTLNQW